MSEGYMGGKSSNECPLLDSIEKKCRGIDIMSGDSRQNLLEACGAHQLCYLCVSFSRSTDVGHLSNAIFNSHSFVGRFSVAMRLRVFERR